MEDLGFRLLGLGQEMHDYDLEKSSLLDGRGFHDEFQLGNE